MAGDTENAPGLRAVEGLPPIKARNENVVQLLWDVLAMAEAGEVHGAVVILEHHDGFSSDRWATMGGLFPNKMVGAIYRCLARYTAHTEQGDE